LPSTLNITLQNSLGTVSIPIAASLQALDSNAEGGTGPASQQTGFSSVQVAIANIFKAGFFVNPATGTRYSASQIESISWS
jgi:hypothetical protein